MGTQAPEQVELTGEQRCTTARSAPVVWRVLREAVLLATLFGVYSAGRQFAAKHTGSAFEHAREVLSWQRMLHLPNEATLQDAVLQVPHLIEAANLYYASVHAPLTAAVLLWLSIWRPNAYPHVRWTMVSVTGLALIGHIVFPLAPPRMLPELGFVDTGLKYGQSVYGEQNSGGFANQFAAMPSLHVGWAVLIALAMILVTRTRWRWLWLAHPIITFAVVVVTANHYWLDGIVVIILLAISLPLLLRPDLRSDRRQDAGQSAELDQDSAEENERIPAYAYRQQAGSNGRRPAAGDGHPGRRPDDSGDQHGRRTGDSGDRNGRRTVDSGDQHGRRADGWDQQQGRRAGGNSVSSETALD